MNILIVEDEPAVANFIRSILREHLLANVLEIANSFDEALSKALSGVFDLILIDIDLSHDTLSGIELCQAIRKNNKRIPLLMVTGFHHMKYMEKAFEAGANDYIAKPFRPRELALRVKRWSTLHYDLKVEKELSYQELTYDVAKNQFYFRGEKLELSKKNKALLLLFLKNPEQILSSQYIQEKFWGDYVHSNKNRNLRSNIQLLRRSLSDSCDDWIKTIRGEGYLLQK